ncbi:MAG: hypothetical protein ACOYLC_08405 [Armatimonadaceae bacterium]
MRKTIRTNIIPATHTTQAITDRAKTTARSNAIPSTAALRLYAGQPMQQRNQTSSRDETLSAYLASEQRLHGVHPEESETEASLEQHPKGTRGKSKVIAALIALSLTLSAVTSFVVPSIREPIVHIASVVRSVRHINDDPNVLKEDAARINAITRNTKVPARVRAAALTILPWSSGKTPVAGTKREISTIWERLSELSHENPSDLGMLAVAVRKGTQGSFRIDRPELENIASPPIDSKGNPLELKPILQTTHPDAIARMRADCARGEKLDPENAFWPLMMASVHLAAHEDAQALTSLARAAKKPVWREYVQDEVAMHREYAEFRYGEQGYLGELVRQTSILFPHYAQLRGLSRALVGQAILLEQAGRAQDALTIRMALRRVSLKISLQSTSDIGSLVGIAMHSIATSRVNGIPPIKAKSGKDGTTEESRKAATLGNMHRYRDHVRVVGQAGEATAAMRDVDKLTDYRAQLMLGTDSDWEKLFGNIQQSLVGAGGVLAASMNIAWLMLLGILASVVIRFSSLGRGGRLAPGTAAAIIGATTVVIWSVSAYVVSVFVNPQAFQNTWGILPGFQVEPSEDAAGSRNMAAGLLNMVGTLLTTAFPMFVLIGALIAGGIQRRASFSRMIAFAFRGAGLVAIVIGVPAVLGIMVIAGRNDIRLMQIQRQEWTGGLEERIAKKLADKPKATGSIPAGE